MINVIDYRRTIYDNDPPDYSGNKKILAERIKKDHPKVIDFHPQIRENEGGYKLSFIKAYDGRCAYCGASIDFLPRTQFQVDHFLPHTDRTRFASKKDAGHMDNLVLACQECNHSKLDYRIPDNYTDILHPDKKKVLEVFQRDEKYYIRIDEKYEADSEITSYYQQLRLGNEMHRLDYLLLSMIGLRDKYPNDNRLDKLDTIIRKLRTKRNIGIKKE